MRHLGYGHIRTSAVDHEVREIAFGGTITFWCEWQGGLGIQFSQQPRVKGRVCMDCASAKRAAVKAETMRKLGETRRAQMVDPY